MKKLTRTKKDKKLCGVCGGIAKYFDLDSTIIRLLFLLILGLNLIVYIVLALIIPESEDEDEVIIEKRLTRSRKDKKLCGVCGGIAEYFELDSTLLRLLFVFFFFVFGCGLFLYIVCALVMPKSNN